MKVDVDGYVHVVPVTPRGTALILETILPEPESDQEAQGR